MTFIRLKGFNMKSEKPQPIKTNMQFFVFRNTIAREISTLHCLEANQICSYYITHHGPSTASTPCHLLWTLHSIPWPPVKTMKERVTNT